MGQTVFSKNSHSIISHPTYHSYNMILTFFSLRCGACTFLNMDKLRTVAAEVTSCDFQGRVTSTSLSWDSCFWNAVTISEGSSKIHRTPCTRNYSYQLKPAPTYQSCGVILKVDLWGLCVAAPPDARWRGEKLLADPDPSCRVLNKTKNCSVWSHYVLGWFAVQ